MIKEVLKQKESPSLTAAKNKTQDLANLQAEPTF